MHHPQCSTPLGRMLAAAVSIQGILAIAAAGSHTSEGGQKLLTSNTATLAG